MSEENMKSRYSQDNSALIDLGPPESFMMIYVILIIIAFFVFIVLPILHLGLGVI